MSYKEHVTYKEESIVAKRMAPQIYRYECPLTGAKYKTTRAAPKPTELVSIRGYYELHPEEDDRPEHIKREVIAMQVDEELPEESELGEESEEE